MNLEQAVMTALAQRNEPTISYHLCEAITVLISYAISHADPALRIRLMDLETRQIDHSAWQLTGPASL